MSRVIVIAMLFLFGVARGIQGQDQPTEQILRPLLGTWKVAGGGEIAVRRFSQRPDGFVVITTVRVLMDGTPQWGEVVFKPDGVERPQYSNDTLAEFLAAGRSSSVTESFVIGSDGLIHETRKDNGLVTGTYSLKVSADGKTLTADTRQLGRDGKWATSVIVFQRQ